MVQSAGVIQKTVQAYQDTKLAFLKKVMDGSDIVDENGFLDNGTIKARINRLKEEHAEIQKEISILVKVNDDRNKDTVKQYMERIQELTFQMAFYASNSLENIEYCLTLTRNINSDFSLCLQALLEYKQGNNNQSFQLFLQYFQDKDRLLEHFLINKVFGTLLFEEKQFKQARVVLLKAVEKRPEDLEIHFLLASIYDSLGLEFEKQMEEKIIGQLGGRNE